MKTIKNLKLLCAGLLLLTQNAPARAGTGTITITDSFLSTHDYKAAGITGAFFDDGSHLWDGVYLQQGDVPSGTGGGGGNTITADTVSFPGFLTLNQINGGWENAQDDGFFLYKVVSGDFDMSVDIVAPYNNQPYNLAGLMARAFNASPSGSPLGGSENFLLVGRFDEFAIGVKIVNDVNGVNSGYVNSVGSNDVNSDLYLRLQRVGDTFNFFYKNNQGDPWTPLNSVNRADLNGLPMQVGIQQGTFNSIQTPTFFANFSLTGNLDPPPVNDPSGLTITPAGPGSLTFTWNPAAGVDGYLVLAKQTAQGATTLEPILSHPATFFTYVASSSGTWADPSSLIYASSNYVLYTGASTSVTISGFGNSNNAYTAVVYAYAFNGVNPDTNYGRGTDIYYDLNPPTLTVNGPGFVTNLGLAVNPNCIPIGSNGQATLTAIFSSGEILNETADPGTVWSSSDPAVIAVTNGFLSALASGCVEITATYGGLSTSNLVCTCDATNCCANCTQPYPLSYTNIVNPGYNFLADDLCQGTNNTLDEVLTNIPDGTELLTWDFATQSYTVASTYFAGFGWFPGTTTLVPGEGFVLVNSSGAAFTLVIQGCQPNCPPPCLPPANGVSLVGQIGIGTPTFTNALGTWSTTWTNLFSCPPPCGAQMSIWNGTGFTVYNYANGAWSPFVPGLAIGQSAFVSVRPETTPPVINCPTNIVVTSCASTQVFYTPTATNPCCGSNVTVVCNPPSGSYFSPGTTTTVNCVATDCNGLSNTCTFTVTAAGGCVPPPPNLVLWLPFDETSGSVSANIAPVLGANNGTQVGSPSVVFGAYVANSLSFNGSQYVSVPSYPAINPAISQAFTLDAWVNRGTNGPNSPPCVILDKRDPNTGNGYSLSVDFGHVFLTLSGINYNSSPAVVPADGQWHFIAVTVSPGTSAVGEFYIDGHAPVAFTPTPAIVATTAPFLVGKSVVGGNQPWQGGIDEVEMFNRALAPGEIQSIYSAGSCGKCKPPCTNFTVICPTNKTVQCGSSWTFDLPLALTCCTNTVTSSTGVVTNVLITSTGIVTNGVCPKVITQTWRLADVCGNSATCSQTVTVVDTTPPTLTCATNKTVQCGAAWSFDAPTAFDACSGTNVTVTVAGTVTNGVCPQLITRTWLATDACGNTNTCSQTVTVVNTNLPVINCSSNIVVVSCTNISVCYNVTASEACCTNVTVVCTPPPCSFFAPGTTNTVHCVATDCCGNSNTCSFTVTVLPCLTPPTNMVLWLPFDETTGPISANIAPVAGANNGTQVGGPTVVLGAYVDNSLSFGGTPKQYVTVPDYPAIDIGTSNFTIDAWVNRATNGPNSFPSVIVDKRDVNTGAGYSLALSYGHPVLAMSGFVTGDAGSRIVPPDGLWHFLAVSVNQSTLNVSFYIDGVLLTNTTPQPGSVYNLANTNALWVGGSSYGDVYGNDRHWTGGLDEVEVFDRALAANELDAIYSAGPCGKCKPPCTNLTVICSTNKSVPCGSTWAFDPPMAISCCGTNVTTTVVSTVTNGTCLINFTGGGSTASALVNFVGNTAVSGYLDITAGSKVGTYPLSPGSGTDGYFYWDGQVFPGTDPFIDIAGLLFTGSGFEINLFGTGPGSYNLLGAPPVYSPDVTGGQATMTVCQKLITRTWLLTDDCGHTNTCSQTVTVVTEPPVLNCATNKTVQCGSKWSFDAPTAFDACSGSNVLITVAGTVTNGVCPQVITRTWLVTDACGNTNSCSQTVTLVDTTPPTIICLTNTTVVDFNTNCQIVIPLIHPQAFDNCTPASQLVYTQSPTNGTVVNAASQYVTVTVTDLCGNSNNCRVLVIGRYPPPVIICPGVVTVTNCVMPNVLPLVSATGCNGGTPFVFSQSPLPGTPLGPGSDTVTVTVTGHGGSDSCVIAVQFGAFQSFLTVLTNTGLTVGGGLLANGAVDPHYTLGPVPAGTPTGAGGYTAPHAVAVIGTWGQLGSFASEWIAPAWTFSNLYSCPPGYYTYTNQFVLPAGLDPSTASISGRWSADDGAVKLLFNGAPTPNTIPLPHGYTHWTPFTISGGFLPNPAKNTILFVVSNTSAYSTSPTGLRVEYTNAFAGCTNCAPPSLVWLTPNQSLPASGTATLTANVAGTPPFTYQWYHNGVPVSNAGPYSGANGPTLTITPLSSANAGVYFVAIGNGCGGIDSRFSRLTVTYGWPWPWATWNFQVATNYLAASFGPDLVLSGTNTLAIASGSTLDFGLPNAAGGIVSVMDVPPLPVDTSIQVPLIAAPGTNVDTSYTVIMDLYEPDTSLGTPSTLFQSIACCVSNLSSGGQDGVALTLDAANNLHLTGSAAGVLFDTGPTANLSVDAWNRVALVVDDPQDGFAVSLSVYLNGQQVGSLTVPTPFGLPVNWSNGAPSLLSRQPTDVTLNGEFDVSSIQFHAAALTPESIAGLGSTADGPLTASDTAIGTQPVMSVTSSSGTINLTWTGDGYVLQETDDLATGIWVDSPVPFTETEVAGSTATTATITPSPSAPSKFYRLVFRP